METQMNRPEFDYDTINEATENVASMFDMSTLEGRRLFEGAMREARIRERDVEGNGVGSRIVIGSGRVTLRDSAGVECEIETSTGPRLLTFQSEHGLVNDAVQIVLIRE